MGYWIKKRYDNSSKQRNKVYRLKNLTFEEKEILLGYFVNESRTQKFAKTDGVVNQLEIDNIIFRSSNIGNLDSWPYNIQPWVWEFLKNHRAEILSDEEIDNFIISGRSPEKESRHRAGYIY